MHENGILLLQLRYIHMIIGNAYAMNSVPTKHHGDHVYELENNVD